VIHNVGYPNQNRSHVRSSDILHSATSAADYVTTGWIGRFDELEDADYPSGYPNPNKAHPFALTIGKIISETCQGVNANYSLALTDPFNPGTALVGAGGNIPADCYGDKLLFINDTVAQTNAFAAAITQAANAGNNLSTKYDSAGNPPLAQKLRHVARLIAGGLQTKIYIVQLGGFDTHDNQVVDGAPTTGRQTDLLQELADAICAFQDDLNLLGLEDRVLGMTYSEFGRRIRSNGSLGTDHGTAAPMFVFGSCIKNQILGDFPEIDTQVGIEDGVPMQYDFRDVYGTFLSQWLGANETEVQQIIHPAFAPLPIIENGCIQTTDITPLIEKVWDVNISPNPVENMLYVNFMGLGSEMKLSLFDGKGAELQLLAQRFFPAENHTLSFNLATLPSGLYYLQVQAVGLHKTFKVAKK